MKFNRILALSAASLAFAAQATVAPGGNLGTLTLFPALYQDTFTSPASGSFADSYTFTLATSSIVYGSIYQTGGTVSITSVLVNAAPSALLPAPGMWGFSSGPLAAGTYSLNLAGTYASANAPAAYIGTIYAVPAAIPEPESLALALGGLGILGAFGMRKRSV